jgi:enolase
MNIGVLECFSQCYLIVDLSGGSHAGNKLAMQEFMILPVGAKNFREALRMGAEVYHNLKSIINKKYGKDSTAVGDEGGFAPNILDNKEGLFLLVDAIKTAGYEGKVKLGMDVAASEFWKAEIGKYDLDFKNAESSEESMVTPEELLAIYQEFVDEFPMISIEGMEQQFKKTREKNDMTHGCAIIFIFFSCFSLLPTSSLLIFDFNDRSL